MINGDQKLSWKEKLLYFPQCIKQWNVSSKGHLSTRFVNLKPTNDETGTSQRRLSNMFWHTLNWVSVSEQLGGQVKVLDIACGAGQYGLKYRSYLGENFSSYTGVDIYEHDDFPPEFNLILDKAENIHQYIAGHNLIVSQSGLEHIEDDLDVLVQALIAQKAHGNQFLQIHLVPAPSTLFLYLWHGWRQYSKKNLALMSERLIELGGVSTLAVPLGGWRSFWVHFFVITVSGALRSLLRKRRIYSWDVIGSSASSKIASAALNDRFCVDRIPTCWAFVIYSDNVDVECLFKSMSVDQFQKEISTGQRFKFGENWKKFLGTLNDDRIKQAETSLKTMLEVENLDGKSFLDVGSGSGLFSLAARNLGAEVVSFDFDETSVWCTSELKNRYYEDDPSWIVMQGSVLDNDFLKTLGEFDYVYSWGVLHHTGDMWRALDNVNKLVKLDGFLFIALYNYQQFATRYWTFVKRTYNKYPLIRPFWILIHFLYPTLPSITLKFLQNRKAPRGMTVWYDLLDWLGGFPFEVSTPKEIFNFYKAKGFTLTELKTVGGKLGCNEYVFRRTMRKS